LTAEDTPHLLTLWKEHFGTIQELVVTNSKLGKTFAQVADETLGGDMVQSLQVLRLVNCQLTELPERIGELQSLQELHLYDNQLCSLPDSICQLQALRLLVLERNQLSSLPERIGELKALTLLNLAGNPIGTMPMELLPQSIHELPPTTWVRRGGT